MIFRSEVLDEEIHHAVVGGMDVFVLPKRGFSRKSAQIMVRYGSNDNTLRIDDGKILDLPPGIAHFLEHKMFEKEWGEAFIEFAKFGASANAYTSNNYTSYLFSTIDSFKHALGLLFDVVFNPYFTPESVAKERSIIAQEIRMYNDEPSSRLARETLSALYLAHPVRIDIAGTEESIEQIDKDMLYRCHGTFYRPQNTSLLVSGDMDPDSVFELAHSFVAPFVGKGSGAAERLRPKEPGGVGDDVLIDLPVPVPMLQVAWKAEPPGDDGSKLVREEIATNLLMDILFGRSSDFYAKTYEEGLLDGLSVSHDSWPDYRFSSVFAQSERPEELARKIREEVSRAESEGLGEIDFVRAQRAAIGRFVTLFDSPDGAAETQAQLHDVGRDIFSYGRALEDVSLHEVSAMFRAFGPKRSVVAIVRNTSGREETI